MAGTLYLIPNSLGFANRSTLFPEVVSQTVNRLDYFIAEHAKSLRKHFKELGMQSPFNQQVFELNKHTSQEDLEQFLTPLLKDHDMGLVSDAGCPGIADPGAQIIALCHRKNIRVTPLIGPSSILLALIASGLNGQGFSFHGYLPVKPHERERKVKQLERESISTGHTQIFIETPYRNLQLWAQLTKSLRPNTRLSISCGLTHPTEFIKTLTIKEWQSRDVPDIANIPAVFSILA